MKKIICLLSLFLAAGSAWAQRISIFDVDTSSFPIMKAKIFALDAEGKQVTNLNASDLSLTENGIPREIISVSCPPTKPAQRISSTIVIDVSGSMSGAPLDIAKTVAKTWINALPLGQSDCALVSFNGDNYFNQDFTTNRNKLLSAIDGLISDDGTDYNAALINPVAGGILTAKAGKHKKVIVFITDGQPNQNPDEARIIAEANANDIMIHCITIGLPAHSSMVNFAEQTHGMLFQNVTNEEEAKKIAQMLLGRSVYDFQPCELEWKSDYICKSSNIEVLLQWKSYLTKINYLTPRSAVANLIVSPSGIRFINKPLGIKADTTVFITAINADIDINSFICSDPRFSISPPALTIIQGETKEVTLSFTPIDSSGCFTSIDIQNNKCDRKYYATSVYPKSRSKVSTLKLTSPNGGEEFIIGNDTLITWEGVLPGDTVILEYTYDNGATWNLITDSATGFRYVWKTVPRPASDKCLVRATSTFNKKPKIEWIRNYGGSNYDFGSIIKETSLGNFILVGTTESNDGDIIDHQWSKDICVFYLDPQGNIIWEKTLGGGRDEDGCSVIETDDGGFIVGGSIEGGSFYKIEYGDKSGGQGYEDFWLTKLDLNGTIEWTKIYGYNTKLNGYAVYEKLRALEKSDDGCLIALVGYLGSGISSWGWDVEAFKIAENGNVIWEKLYGGSGLDNPRAIAKLSTGGYIISALTNSTDGDVDNKSEGSDGWVFRISDNGDFEWGKTYGTQCPTSIAQAHTEDYVFSLDNYIVDITSKGDYVNKKIHGHENDKILALNSTMDLANVFAGSYYDNISNLNKFWIGKINKENSKEWEIKSDLQDLSALESIQEVSDGSFIACGSVKVTGSDILVVKLSQEVKPQSDVSDSVFSIVAPTIASRNVDMGRVILGAYKDSLITSFIENKSRFECKIKDIRLTGADAADFYVISNKQFTLAGGEKKAIEFHFKPGALGARNALIEIESQDSILTQSIIGEGVQPQIQLSTKLIDFGVVEVTQSKDTVLFLIKNLDKNPITITNTKLLGPDYKQFEIVAGGGTFTLQPDSLRELKLAFNPVYVGRTSSDIGFYFNGPGSPARAQLFGRGIGGLVFCTEDSAAAGEKATINLCLGNVKINSVNKLASSFRASIQYEKSLLAPVDRSLVKSVGKDSAYLEIHGNIGKDSVLYPIEFIAGLGANESTSIDITDFKWLDETGKEIEYDTETESGSFKLLGVCREGGARLVNPTGKADILSLAPNPATDEITVTVNKIEEGESFIVIYNSLGAEAGRIALSGAPLGEKEVKISLASYPRGAYFVRFQTPTVSTGRMVIFE